MEDKDTLEELCRSSEVVNYPTNNTISIGANKRLLRKLEQSERFRDYSKIYKAYWGIFRSGNKN